MNKPFICIKAIIKAAYKLIFGIILNDWTISNYGRIRKTHHDLEMHHRICSDSAFASTYIDTQH